MADWNIPNSALSGEDDVGSTVEAMVKLYCFHVSAENEVQSFLFGIQSVETATELMKRAYTLLQRCQSISPHLLPSHGNRMLYFFSDWLQCDMKKDISPDIKSRMALMMSLYEDHVTEEDREYERAKGIEKAEGAAALPLKDILNLLRDMKNQEPALSLQTKPFRPETKDIATYSNHKALTGIFEALTLLTTMAFKSVCPSDFFIDKSPRLTLLANLFDRVSYWVATSIVRSAHPAKAITFFIMLGVELHKAANYDMLLALLTGLGNIAITRLTNVWASVSQKKVQKFEKLEEFMDPAGGYRNYRTKLREHAAGKPCIPYFALCLRDLTYIRDGAPTYLDSNPDSPTKAADTPREAKKLLNVRKIHLIGKCLHEFFEKMDLNYQLNQPDLDMMEQIRSFEVMDDDKLFSESLKKQPPPVDFDCFQLNPDFFSTIIVEKGISKEVADPLADKLSELSLEELAALDRKSIKQLGITKLRDIVSVLNSVHTAIGVPPFLLRPAHTWTADEVVEWGTLTEFDKSVIKKLKEKKFDGKALVEMTPDTVKTVIPEKHRPMFLEHLSELQDKSGLAIALRTKLQNKMKKDEVSKNFFPDSETTSLTLPGEASRSGSERFQPLAGPRGGGGQLSSLTEDFDTSNTFSAASEDCLTDDGGDNISFIHLDDNKRQVGKANKSYTPDITLFKMRIFAKKKFGFKPSFYGQRGDGTFFIISNDAEMSKWLKSSKPKKVFVMRSTSGMVN